MRIVWTASARRDLITHFDYLATRDPDAAIRMDDAIRSAIARLTDFPNRGRPGRREATRELVVAHWPYVIVYVVRDATVAILRILHTSQEWPPRDA
ncbi:MAG: type II toxin-antitoxin system RelE/ParE family toxin [Thermomicrobiales bacterium]